MPTDVPQLEVAIALKFAAMASGTRPVEDKHQDAHDFIRMIKHNPSLDLRRLADFGELVYPGGGASIEKLVDDVKADRQLIF